MGIAVTKAWQTTEQNVARYRKLSEEKAKIEAEQKELKELIVAEVEKNQAWFDGKKSFHIAECTIKKEPGDEIEMAEGADAKKVIPLVLRDYPDSVKIEFKKSKLANVDLARYKLRTVEGKVKYTIERKA